MVAPFAGAWIETDVSDTLMLARIAVAPFAGAWIETIFFLLRPCLDDVAPFAGAWIETISMTRYIIS